MSLIGKLFGSGKRSPESDSELAMPSFEVDRSRMFDPALSDEVVRLAANGLRSGDEAWEAAFFGALWNAAIIVPSPNPFIGPDGFAYLRIELPPGGNGEIDVNSLSNIAESCVEAGCGAALFADLETDQPIYVMPMGVLESLRQHGNWRGDPVDLSESGDPVDTVPAGSKIMTGAPSKTYLSPDAARALDRFLKDQWAMDEPRVLLMMSPALQPSRSLVINVRSNSFKTDEDANIFCRQLMWFMPPSRTITLWPDDWVESDFVPLATLY